MDTNANVKYFSRDIETAPRSEIESLQSYRLSRTVRQVYERVPFYRKKFDEMGLKPEDIRSIADITKLPFTVKTDLRDNYPYGLFAEPMENVVRIHASSGTTGKQTVVGYTKDDIDTWAICAARALAAAGADRSDFVHVSYGYGLFTGGMGLHYGAEKLGATVIPVSTGNTHRQVQIIQDFGSSVICCTPSYALYIAETLEEMGVDPGTLHLKAGLFGAEPWTEKMRQEIERRLKIRAYDIYGLSEVMGPGVAYDCCAQNGMHVNEDFFYVEILDPETLQPVPDGQQGEIVFTTLNKQALPLLRYRTKDIGSITHEKCACGRTFVRMSKPCGRVDDMLIIRGVNVFPSQVESVLLSLGMTNPYYQLIVDRVGNLDTLEIVVEMNDALFSDSIREIENTQKTIRAAVESTLGISAKIRLVEPKSLPRSEGKAKHVIDNRKL